jgi:hypothetical protein
MTEYLKPTRDSVALWFYVPSEQLPDTIKGEIVYRRPDSLGVMAPYTQALKLAWKKSESREEQRERERLEKEAERAAEQGVAPPAAANPFKYTMNQSTVNPGGRLKIGFDLPLASIDSTVLRLTSGEAAASKTVPVRMVRDTAELRTWWIEAPWTGGEKYDLTIPAAALRDISGLTNDSIGRRIDVPRADQMGTVRVEVAGLTPESEYIVELTSETGSPLEVRRHVRTETVEFAYVTPGKVRLKITEDTNGNGEWNTGNLVSRSQPERVEFFMNEPGEPSFDVRAGWVETKKIDMGELFAPMTIEALWKRLESEEAVRLEKLIEDLAKRLEEKRRQEAQGTGSQSQSIDPMNMMRGSGLMR